MSPISSSIYNLLFFPIRQASYYKNTLINPLKLKIRSFKTKLPLYIEKEKYIIKTAQNDQELYTALKLRFHVFYNELLNKKLQWGIDIDKYDLICDHILIIDKRINRCVGTYRVNSSKFSNSFYSSFEFNISSLNKLHGHKLELGRACISSQARNGMVIALLWKGIYEYMRASDSRYLFGVSSIKNTEPNKIANLSYYLSEYNPLENEICDIQPNKRFILKKHRYFYNLIKDDPGLFDEAQAKALIPPLLKGYLKMGAFVCGEPALDRAFKCVDYFTILDTQRLDDNIIKRYEKN